MKNIKYNLILISILSIIILPNKTFAAKISASSTDTISSGDTSIINIYIDTEGQQINSIDGAVVLKDENDGNFEIKDLSISNSAFSMWPVKPSLEDGHKIKFIGGIPGGIKGERLLIFKVIVKINQPGKFSIIPETTTAYLNDGIPTPIIITKEISRITIGAKKAETKDLWKEVISNDNNAPLAFKIELIQDPYLYEGRKFIMFTTTDEASGISYYEVKEGDREPVRSGTNYVLIDQKKNTKIVVTAYDKAGNFQIATLNTREPIHWGSILITLLILGILYKIIKRFREKRKQKNAI